MILTELLRYVAHQPSTTTAHRLLAFTETAPDREFQWVVDAGIGPLLGFSLGSMTESLSKQRRDVLLAADLVAQVRYGELLGTTIDAIGAAEAVGTELTLLKGISISSQYYPKPHFRPMSDIDLLLPASAYHAVESEMIARGFTHGRPLFNDAHHHGVPLHDRRRDTWVELHTSLVPPSSELIEDRLFSLDNVISQSVDSELAGAHVRRLAANLQLPYICCTWSFDLIVLRFHPSFVTAVFDAVFLLRAESEHLDWHLLFTAADSDMSVASILVMLTFLKRHEVLPCPSAELGTLAARQRWVGPMQLRLIHWALDRYLLAGRTWNAPIPPPVVGRYSPRRQFEKRLLRRMRPSN